MTLDIGPITGSHGESVQSLQEDSGTSFSSGAAESWCESNSWC